MNLGKVATWLLVVLGLSLSLLTPYMGQRLYWALESDRILEETDDPILVAYVPGEPEPTAHGELTGGQTAYVKRTYCIYKRVTGDVSRAIVGTAAVVTLPSTHLDTYLVPGTEHYGQDGRLAAPPWCVKRLFPVTIPDSTLNPGPVRLRAEGSAYLNPDRRDVRVHFRDVPFVLTATAVQRRLDATAQKAQELERQLATLRRAVKRVEHYVILLDAYLRERHVLPPVGATP